MIKYLNETSKSIRYDRIEEAIIERINDISEEYKKENGIHRVQDDNGECHQYDLTEEQADEEAYDFAVRKFLDSIDSSIGNDMFYWIAEIIISDNFDWTPSKRNPFAVHNKKDSSRLDVSLSPYGIMFKIK